MAKYIIYLDSPLRERRYLTNVINKRPYSSASMSMAQVCENKELAEFIAEQAYRYSGNKWKVQEVEVL